MFRYWIECNIKQGGKQQNFVCWLKRISCKMKEAAFKILRRVAGQQRAKSPNTQLETISCQHKAQGSNNPDQEHREEVVHKNSDGPC